MPGRHAAQPRPGRTRQSRPAARPGGRHSAHGAVPVTGWHGSRIAAIGVLGGIALALLVFQYQVRDLEADVAAHLFGIVTPTLAASSAPIIWFGLGGENAFGLVITPDCSSALLIVPLCGLGMLLMIPRKLAVGRVAKALVVAATLLVAGNMLRIGVIAVATRVGGIGAGYQFGHLVLGSFISIVCIALSLVLLTAIITSRDGGRLSALLRRHRRAVS